MPTTTTGNKFIADYTTEVACQVCARRFSREYADEIGGMFVCPMCTRYKHMVHLYRFAEFVARGECEDAVLEWVEGGAWGAVKQSYCNLDCSCLPCSARKVLRFYHKMTKATFKGPIETISGQKI